MTEKRPNYSDKNQESSQKAADAYDELMKKERTHYYSYKDLRPSYKASMDAFDQLIEKSLKDTVIYKDTRDSKDNEKPKKVEAKSMPSVFQKAKEALMAYSSDSKYRRSKINKLAKIYENAKDKELGAKTLKELNLPKYKRIKTTVNDFLKNPKKYFSSLKSDLYFPSVMNEKTGERHFELGLDKFSTITFLKNLLKKEIIGKDYSLILCEYQKNDISGNITINPPVIDRLTTFENNGGISIELVKGEHADLAYGDKSPIIIARTGLSNNHPSILNFDVSLKNMEFSEPLMKKINSRGIISSYVGFLFLKNITEAADTYHPFIDIKNKERDLKVIANYRRLIDKTLEVLSLIPKDQDNGSNFSVDGKAYHPGYYEFIVNPAGVPYFIDYRKPEHYSDLQHTNVEGAEVSD